jgi:UDP:flavonoid glycosyltransferase YjiC (YdhE family)
MHFAIFGPPLRGHYGPLSNLASELIARGHRATFIHHADAAALVEADDAGFEPIGAGSPQLASWTGPMARIKGVLGLGGVMDGMVRFTDMICRDAPALLERLGVDAVLVDQLEPGGALVAQRLGLPFISLAIALPINREPGVPPPYVGWAYDPSPGGLKRNRGGWRVTDLVLGKVGKAIERNSTLLGLPPRRRLEDCFSPLLQVAQLVPGLDFPRHELPENFHYTGPFRRAGRDKFSLPPGDERPLVYCTLGTLQGSRTGLFRKVAAACAKRDLRLLMTSGRATGRHDLEQLPGNPLVYDWVPQEAVLEHVSLTVCHGGMNSVLDSLAAGVPMVVMPLAFEQSAIAARMQYAGVAEFLSARSSSRQIANSIAMVREVPSFQARARAIQQEFRQAGGVSRAADLIEEALGPGAAAARQAAATTAGAAQDDVRGGSRSESS